MKNFDTRVYSISDFLEWNQNNLLLLSPDFQRRAVWSLPAKSYLIDTILRGKPIPKMIISQKMKGARTMRIVVDGQQRLRAILEFKDDAFKILSAHNITLAGKTYSTLPKEMKDEFIQYELGVDLLFDTSYEDILDIFARLNSYTVVLNKQEKFNAKYLGYFKQLSYKYGYKYVQYFLDGKILTKIQVNRMGEAELSADLFMAILGGVQSNKNVESYYKEYENEPKDIFKAAEKFDKIMSYIGSIYPPEEIALTNWSRIHLFYSLFTVIGHNLFSFKGVSDEFKINYSKNIVTRLRVILDQISSKYDEVADNLEDETQPAEFKLFISWSRRATTDSKIRINRTEFICKEIKNSI